ncbi:MAG: helix-turn-helix domain-containing protein, partial [Brochothrix thermosphacta]
MTSLSSQERTVIQTLLELNYSVRAIARFIKRSPSTVSIETRPESVKARQTFGHF